ncbi:hypothetical protein GIB67_020099 [Kingdonia uniflora]|uniref:Uncharacterized protein n=1 Tax=Kingdonia uniflora TaxID=39325 RepID=A0A7J7L2I2_9MAGN|nr:hypothetical protein GIB67_020099 [Kingdonia uniflora]
MRLLYGRTSKDTCIALAVQMLFFIEGSWKHSKSEGHDDYDGLLVSEPHQDVYDRATAAGSSGPRSFGSPYDV